MFARSHQPSGHQRRREAVAMAERIGRIPGRRALDVGCGRGLYTRLLIDLGASWVTAIDRDARCLDHLPRDRVTAQQADAASFASMQPVDIIVAGHLLDHCRAPRKTLNNLRRSAVTGTRLILLVTPPTLPGLLLWLWTRLRGRIFRTYSARALGRLAFESGWDVEETISLWPFGLIMEFILRP